MHMDGQEVYKFAVSTVPKSILHVLEKAGLTAEDISYFALHQANIRIIDAALSRLKIGPEKCLTNIADHGNTSAACAAILLDEANRAGKLKKGDLLAMTAFGGGLTTGACILRWDK